MTLTRRRSPLDNWRTPVNFEDSMRSMQKRIGALQRRPAVSTAQSLLGPGFAPHAVEIVDWNSDEAAYNGFFYSSTEALNSPDETYGWIGQTIATQKYGIQVIRSIHDASGVVDTTLTKQRGFFAPGGSTPRLYQAWT